jgi:hypothetical protein
LLDYHFPSESGLRSTWASCCAPLRYKGDSGWLSCYRKCEFSANRAGIMQTQSYSRLFEGERTTDVGTKTGYVSEIGRRWTL